MDMEASQNFSQNGAEDLAQAPRMKRRSPSVQYDEESKAAKHNANLLDFNQSAMSPLASGRNTIDYSTTAHGDEATTQDMTRVNNFKSASKMKADKRNKYGVSPQPAQTMKPMRNPTWDNPSESMLPDVRGAQRANR